MQGQELDFKLGNVTIYNAKLVPKYEFEKKKEEAEEELMIHYIGIFGA